MEENKELHGIDDKCLPITTVTNVRMLCDIMNEVEIGKTMLSGRGLTCSRFFLFG